MRHYNWDEIEPRIKPLVDALNKLKGVRTISSCEGHPGTDVLSDGTRRNSLAYVSYYVSKKHETAHEKWLVRVVEDSIRRHGYRVYIEKIFRPLRRTDSGKIVRRPARYRWLYEIGVWTRGDPDEEKARMLLDRGIRNLVELAGRIR